MRQRAEGRGQRAEGRGQRAEGRGQRAEGALLLWLGMGLAACEGERAEPIDPGLIPPVGDLEHRVDLYLPGLREWVTVSKSATARLAIRDSGRVQPLPELWDEEQAAWRSRHGRASLQLANRLESARASDKVAVVVTFLPDHSPEALDGVWHSDEASLAAEEERAASHARAGTSLLPRLEALGFELDQFDPALPWMTGWATPEQIRAIAGLDGVEAVGDATPGELVRHQTPNSMTEPQIDITFNAQGYRGEGQKVGIVETKCYVWTEHDTFAPDNNSSVTFRDTGFSSGCNPNLSGACNLSCGAESDAATACRLVPQAGGNRCVDRHQTWVASAIKVKRSGGTYGAGNATLFVANGGDIAPCQTNSVGNAYNWFKNNGVPTVNESWGCDGAPETDGMVQDYHSRTGPGSGPSSLKILVTKSAGNDNSSTYNSNYYGNRACARTLNSLCVGATQAGGIGMMAEPSIGPNYASSWLNPDLPSGSDREEPDLAAFGSSVVVARIDAGQTDWQNAAGGYPISGTSFAAPIIATEAVLLRQYCTAQGKLTGDWPLFARSALQAAAYAKNPDGWKYSTVAFGLPTELDHKDGAGYPYGGSAMGMCSPGGAGNGGVETGTITLNQGGIPPRGGTCTNCGGIPPGQQSYAAPPTGSTDPVSWWRNVGPGLTFTAGTRIRAVFNWHSCAISASGSGPSPRGVDFDLFLVNRTTNKWVYASQSIDNVSEGFDVLVPEAGLHEAWVRWPKSGAGSSCNGGATENYAFGWVTPP